MSDAAPLDLTLRAPDPADPRARRAAFLVEADRLKSVLRASPLADRSRRENSAEHSWHVALCALVLAPEAAPGVNIDRVIRMMLLHDLVEIDAGDTPLHGTRPADQDARERAAADRLFAILPEAEGAPLRALWDEFEAAETPDARFAKALDRSQPVLLNLASGGGTWNEYAVDLDRMDRRVGAVITRAAPGWWDWLRRRVAGFLEARG